MTALRPCETCNRLVATEEMVTISAAEYRELLARPPLRPGKVRRLRLSRLMRDPEVGNYVLQVWKTGQRTIQEVSDLCVERFGRERVPSKTAIHRHLSDAARRRIAELRGMQR